MKYISKLTGYLIFFLIFIGISLTSENGKASESVIIGVPHSEKFPYAAMMKNSFEMALEVIKEDKQVDAEYRSAIRSLMTFMMEDPRSISQVHNVLWVLRALERIGDHAANIAEHVIFMVRGKDVRHMSLSDAEKTLNG